MSKKGVNLTPEIVGTRVAEWLAREYPCARSKRLAREFAVSPNTVKRWFAGCRPAGEHFDRMVARWGDRFLAHVYAAAVRPWTDAAMDDEVRDLRRRLDAIAARIGQDDARGPQP